MKKELRKISIEKRKFFDTEKLSKKILENLFSTDEYKKAQNIICYYPLNYEVSTLPCFEDNTKNFFLPRVKGNELEICPYEKNKIKTGSYNIKEPETKAINNFNNIDLIVIPAVAADKNGYRIGYGKGYYDRFLKQHQNQAKKIILVFSELLYETIVPEEFDIKSDIVITDKEILRI
ncbi:5-formyltetrahydrofolate cyclo-ligase [bacterium]|nr:5-formyltetrahydrofolate cyclo-ligase [bacterium]